MKINEIEIKTEYITLAALLKYAGIAETGGHAKELILCGNVYVNGEKCLLKGKKLYNGDEIKFDGEIFKVKKV